ncbi:MAG: GNAT family N-acetyltransferase [Oscillospiraceae bacterium]|nr:GNAT family N-acetyltransferase [Oscillospiraceae bacterium]
MIRFAESGDIEAVRRYDRHIEVKELSDSIEKNRVIIKSEKGGFIGWLRYNLFWDNTPFLNMLFILEEYRGRGYGSALLEFWEREMSGKNYGIVMTSTLADERGQFFYRKNGYTDCGALLLPGKAAEIFFMKKLGK